MTKRRPNILFLFSDQHNAKCLSSAGHPQVKTPHLDSLVEDGIRFTNAYCNNPICTPSRMSFLSSLYPSTHGYYGLYGHAPSEPITSMFEYFRKEGYRTGALGKLHTPRYWIEQHCQFVYDEFIEYPKYLEGAGLYERNDNRGFRSNCDSEESAIPFEHSCEVALAKQAIRFIHNQGEPKDRGGEDAPWFAWVTFARPHQPYTPSSPYSTMYPPETIQLPPNSPDFREGLDGIIRDGKSVEEYVSAYYALVTQVDAGIGMILDELQRIGQLDNTIILYSSDHGDYAGECHLVEKKGGISKRAITNIPCILRLPYGEYGGQVLDEIVESVDVFPSLCDIAGMAIPNTCQGISFYPMVTGNTQSIKESALTENPYRKAIATKAWRYVANIDGQEDELYSLQDDPWECHNLIHEPAHQDRVMMMQRMLLDRLTHARKPINVINGGWHEHQYDLDGRINLHKCGDMNRYW